MESLFQMNEREKFLLDNLVDRETGEINPEVEKELEQLDIDKADKIDGWCYFLKQSKAELEAMENLLKDAETRVKNAKHRYNVAKDRFQALMDGEKFKSSMNTVYYRQTVSVEVEDFDKVLKYAQANNEDIIRYKQPEINKTALLKEIRDGIAVPGACIVANNSMIIK